MSQEDVMKLKANMGRMARTTLSLIASSMEQTEFYKQRVFRYCKEAPLVAQWSPKLKDYEARFQHMEVDEDGVQL